MDTNVSSLLALRAQAVERVDAVLAAAKAENREISDAEVDQLATENGDITKIDATIERAERAQAQIEAAANNRTRKSAALPGKAVTEVREAVADDLKRGWKSLGEFANACWTVAEHGAIGLDKRLLIGAAATGMQQGLGTDGGFAVPPAFARTIWDGTNQGLDSLMSQCDLWPVTGSSLTLAANAETSRATGSRYGGVRGYWISEASQITSSKPTIRQIKIEPNELAALVYMTDKLLRNNEMALEQFVQRAAIEELQFLSNDAIVNGDGLGKPKGILNSACRVTVAKETGQSAATIVKKNIDKMWSRMHPRGRARSAWYINVDTDPELQNLAIDVGTGGAPAYMPPGGLSAAPYGTMKGRPVVPIEFCATLGTEGDIILADLSFFIFATRGGVRSDASMHLRFDYGETAFRFMFEADGQPWLTSPITPFKGSNTLSPFVTLATRA